MHFTCLFKLVICRARQMRKTRQTKNGTLDYEGLGNMNVLTCDLSKSVRKKREKREKCDFCVENAIFEKIWSYAR